MALISIVPNLGLLHLLIQSLELRGICVDIVCLYLRVEVSVFEVIEPKREVRCQKVDVGWAGSFRKQQDGG